MSLSCECAFDGDYDWYYEPPHDYTNLETKQRRRCCSCKTLINLGSTVAKFYRDRPPKDDIELNIYGEGGEVPLATWYMCEECADLYFSISELGFCINLGNESMRYLAKQYHEAYQARG